MRNFKGYSWIIPILGNITCSIALFSPAAFFENIVWHHQITNWIWGYYSDKLNLTITSGFYTNPLQFFPSIISSLIICSSILMIFIGLIKDKSILKQGSFNFSKYILFGIVIITSTILWLMMMEFAEVQIYDLSMWSRYKPCFGVIGLFLGGALIILGSILTKFLTSQ